MGYRLWEVISECSIEEKIYVYCVSALIAWMRQLRSLLLSQTFKNILCDLCVLCGKEFWIKIHKSRLPGRQKLVASPSKSKRSVLS